MDNQATPGAPTQPSGDRIPAERVGDHGDPFWQAEFPLMVAWAFGG